MGMSIGNATTTIIKAHIQVLSPSSPRQETGRPSPDTELSRLIQQQDSHAKRHWQEPMLHRHCSRAKHVMEFRHVEEEDGDEQGEDDGGEQVPVEAVVEDRQAAGAQGEEVEPLHDDEVDEAGRLVSRGGVNWERSGKELTRLMRRC